MNISLNHKIRRHLKLELIADEETVEVMGAVDRAPQSEPPNDFAPSPTESKLKCLECYGLFDDEESYISHVYNLHSGKDQQVCAICA